MSENKNSSILDLDFSWALVDPRLTTYFKEHRKRTTRAFFKLSDKEVKVEFEKLFRQVELYYPELKGKRYGWMITNIGVLLRLVD